MPFEFQHLDLPGLVLVTPRSFPDDRGVFAETYKLSDFAANGVAGPFVQDNWSRSRHGVLRGLHFQLYPKAQGKLVSVTRGVVFDVAVDLREDSPTYLQWRSVCLSHENKLSLYIPAGFAHGFCVLSDEAEVSYKTTMEFDASLDGGIAWNDAEIGVRWPIESPVLSPKDAALPRWQEVRPTFVYREGQEKPSPDGGSA